MTTTAKKPQPADKQTLDSAVELIYVACRSAERHGWTVGQECGANVREKLIEPLYTLLLDTKGQPVTLDNGDTGQDMIAGVLTDMLGVRIVRSRVDMFCDGVDSAGWGHPISDDPNGRDSWFKAGWRLGLALEEGRKPWTKAVRRPRKASPAKKASKATATAKAAP